MPGLTRYILRAYGRRVSRAWEMWPELFWLNILIAFVNAASAVVIIRQSPESAAGTVPPLILMSAVFTVGIIAALFHNRHERKEARERARAAAIRDRADKGDAIPPDGIPSQRSADGDS